MASDVASLPSRTHLRWGGISMILSQILFSVAWILHTNLETYRKYDVKDEEDIVILHEELSSNAHRTRTEIACGCMWASFPLLLIALYALNGVLSRLVHGTKGEMFIYLMEKACLIFIIYAYIVFPAISLVSVSFDWSFKEYTVDDKQVATGYYIQMYTILFQLELIDSVAIADATFVLSVFLAIRFMLYGATHHNQKFLEFRSIVQPSCCSSPSWMMVAEIVSSCLVVALLIIFCIILFEFAAEGFFSPAGYAKFLIGFVIFSKIFMGVRMVVVSGKDKYERVEALLGDHESEPSPSLHHEDSDKNELIR